VIAPIHTRTNAPGILLRSNRAAPVGPKPIKTGGAPLFAGCSEPSGRQNLMRSAMNRSSMLIASTARTIRLLFLRAIALSIAVLSKTTHPLTDLIAVKRRLRKTKPTTNGYLAKLVAGVDLPV